MFHYHLDYFPQKKNCPCDFLAYEKQYTKVNGGLISKLGHCET